MRVLVVTHVFPRLEHDPSAPFLLTWARALQAGGAEVAVLAPHDPGLPGRAEVAGVPVRFVRYAPQRWERLAYRGQMHRLAASPAGAAVAVGLLAALAAAVRAEERARRPDVVHAHWWLPGAVAVRLARVRAPVVCTVHGTDVALVEKRPRLAPLARWALAGAARVEAVSSDLSARLTAVAGRPADAVNPMPLRACGPAASAAPPRPDGPLRILAVGRLVAEKGFADLVAACARLHPAATLEIVGDGPERARLRAQARALEVDLRLPGTLPPAALQRAYLRADVVVQPSHREGFGLVAAEALACGTPVVASDTGGARDLLDACALTAPGDVRALAGRLAAVAADPAGARADAARRSADVRRWLSPSAAAARTLAGYRTLA